MLAGVFEHRSFPIRTALDRILLWRNRVDSLLFWLDRISSKSPLFVRCGLRCLLILGLGFESGLDGTLLQALYCFAASSQWV